MRARVTPLPQPITDTRACVQVADVNIDHRNEMSPPHLVQGAPTSSPTCFHACWPSGTSATAGHRVGLNSRLRAFPCGASPSGGFPSSAAVPRHRGLCPLAVRWLYHPHRVTAAKTTKPHPTSRPCSTTESVATPGVATWPRSFLPWACVPDRTRSRCEPAAGKASGARPKAEPTTAAQDWRGKPPPDHAPTAPIDPLGGANA